MDEYTERYGLNEIAVRHARGMLGALGIPTEGPHHGFMAQRLVRYLTWLQDSAEPFKLTTFPNENPRVDHMVVVPHIPFWSACSHHGLPFHGDISVAYVPKDVLIGLSKVPLLVRSLARGFWLQEHLAHRIADALEEALNPPGAAVQIRATHTCQMLDLEQPPIPELVTDVLRGYFHPIEGDGISREEFLAVIGSPGGRR